MNNSAIRLFVRSLVLEAKEAKEKGGLPKSGGKLVHLKKELDGLKKMKESLAAQAVNENAAEPFVAEYAHMQKFVNELEKIKAAHAKLSEMLTNQINEVEGKITTETQKVKEMMGIAEPEKKEKKADKSATKSKHEKGESKAEEKKEHTKKMDEAFKIVGEGKLNESEILNQLQQFLSTQIGSGSDATSVGSILTGLAGIGVSPIIINQLYKWWEKKHPESFKKAQDISAHMDKTIGGNQPGQGNGVKLEARFKKGEDVGKPGKGFAKIAKAAEKEYGSKEAGKKVAGAVLKKVVAKK
jgi:flagellar biosynthesis chaperone FliJ